MKRTDPLSVRQIIDLVMDDAARQGSFLEMRASYLWSDVVGPGVNSYTTRRYVRDGVLHVWLTSGPLKSELGFQRREICRSINDILGSEVLHDIRFH